MPWIVNNMIGKKKPCEMLFKDKDNEMFTSFVHKNMSIWATIPANYTYVSSRPGVIVIVNHDYL